MTTVSSAALSMVRAVGHEELVSVKLRLLPSLTMMRRNLCFRPRVQDVDIKPTVNEVESDQENISDINGDNVKDEFFFQNASPAKHVAEIYSPPCKLAMVNLSAQH
ncbi:hypothetical protein V496_01953 [Pseudogymnoascus sp. VKM F-4515 (FW-2607)]|nr:hypothetical protein V496_01953 [Pseudogymnoascus sp. VKM F-4515 (FW-2607)]